MPRVTLRDRIRVFEEISGNAKDLRWTRTYLQTGVTIIVGETLMCSYDDKCVEALAFMGQNNKKCFLLKEDMDETNRMEVDLRYLKPITEARQ